ncbi:repeat element protein-b14.1 [Ichnoviriform fugitivi]|uniref:Repeat element protein-b14.1 n=1 Tax=Ichnoviriform fugitivi TaxID=265522 RepID=A2Q0F0_9VIRU|nr:repeat element protein-b14.1 [Ichnoviriform fugitivi]BAF45665.1 repeat element protein-b14.1 [Ichnoviriform fugitivi]
MSQDRQHLHCTLASLRVHESLKVTKMSSSRESGSRMIELPLPRLGSIDKQVVLPFDIILYIAQFTDYVHYKNFVQALWPHKEGSYNPEIQKKLWQMSTHRLTTPFINGEFVMIEYNFDANRTSNPLLINSESLRPVFGSIVPLGDEQFLSVTTLRQFVDTHVRLNACSEFLYASCPCGENTDDQTARAFLKPKVQTCEKGHFHHYCSHHVNFWLNKLATSLLYIQKNKAFDMDANDNFIPFLDTQVFFRGSKIQILGSLLHGGSPPSRRRSD